MNYSQFHIDDLVNEIQLYFKVRDPKPTDARDDAECNNRFKVTDGMLSRLLATTKRQIADERVPGFGLMLDYSIKPSDNALTKKCCNCPTSGVTYSYKNLVRRSGDQFLRTWLQKVSSFSTITQPLRSPIDSRASRKVGAKNPMR